MNFFFTLKGRKVQVFPFSLSPFTVLDRYFFHFRKHLQPSATVLLPAVSDWSKHSALLES